MSLTIRSDVGVIGTLRQRKAWRLRTIRAERRVYAMLMADRITKGTPIVETTDTSTPAGMFATIVQAVAAGTMRVREVKDRVSLYHNRIEYGIIVEQLR